MKLPKDTTFPIRINKYLALAGISSRKEADQLIKQGLIHINKKVAKLGDTVQEKDLVTIARTLRNRTYRYYAYNKPKGIVTNSPQQGEKDILASISLKGVHPIGRLDKDTTGLILLTDDRRITDAILNPKNEHKKEYSVSLNEAVSDSKLRMLERGVQIEGYRTLPAKVVRLGNKSFSLTITEGKKHQVRRMCASIGVTVRSLKRTRIMHIHLGSLKPNQFRTLSKKEVERLLQSYTQSS